MTRTGESESESVDTPFVEKYIVGWQDVGKHANLHFADDAGSWLGLECIENFCFDD